MRNIQRIVTILSIYFAAKVILAAEQEEGHKIGEHIKIPFGTFDFWLYIFYATSRVISNCVFRRIVFRLDCWLFLNRLTSTWD